VARWLACGVRIAGGMLVATGQFGTFAPVLVVGDAGHRAYINKSSCW
jgi:hypothetical protein